MLLFERRRGGAMRRDVVVAWRGEGNAGLILRWNCGTVLRRLRRLCQSLRAPIRPIRDVGRFTVDYVIAGITALFLFVYLLYALLRPEKF